MTASAEYAEVLGPSPAADNRIITAKQAQQPHSISKGRHMHEKRHLRIYQAIGNLIRVIDNDFRIGYRKLGQSILVQ